MADNADDDSQYRIKEGDYVVLKRGDIFKSVQIQLKKKVVFEKQWFFLDKAIGELYRTTFEIVSGGILQPQKKQNSAESTSDTLKAGTDNRNIVDDGKSQKLTRDDIETLKEQGLKGQEIVQHLVDNSTTFRDKTEYAQAKYIKKKKKKYENTVTILKPSCRILAMMYHGREPGKVCHLRYDTLALMLTMSNIHAGSKILVFETCAGLVLGAVMERMGGYGSVVQLYPGGGPVRTGMESFGFPAHFRETLHEFPICHVNAVLAGTLDTAATDRSAAAATEDTRPQVEGQNQPDPGHQGGPGEDAHPQVEGQNQPDPGHQGGPGQQNMETSTGTRTALTKDQEKLRELRAQEKKVKVEEKRKKLAAAAALLEGRNADGLVIASRFHPCPVLLGLIKFLAPSRPFVVYSQYKETLVECFTKLKEQGGTVHLKLTDSWLRHYQVLPNRTHPLLLMSGGGGYLLSGITVATDNGTRPTGPERAEEPAPKRLKLTEAEG